MNVDRTSGPSVFEQGEKRGSITVVSGMPRSGTSVVMQMLVAGGMPALSDAQRTPDENNPRGYLEFEPVKRLRTDQSWLEEAHGRAVKIIHLLLRELPRDGRFQYRVLFVRRPLAEVIASQQAMLARAGKMSAEPEALVRIFESQLAEAERELAAHSCFTVHPIEYHHLLREPLAVAQAMDEFLGGGLAVAAMAQAVDPQLYRQRQDSLGGR